jgi:hypothetical protein
MVPVYHSWFSLYKNIDESFDLFPVLSEPKEDAISDNKGRRRGPPVSFDKFFPCVFIRPDIFIYELYPFGRKKIFQCMAVASMWRRVKYDFRFVIHILSGKELIS